METRSNDEAFLEEAKQRQSQRKKKNSSAKIKELKKQLEEEKNNSQQEIKMLKADVENLQNEYNQVLTFSKSAIEMMEQFFEKMERLEATCSAMEEKNMKLKTRIADLEKKIDPEKFDESLIAQKERKIDELPDTFSSLVEMTEKKYHSKVYSSCFTGQEAVTAVMHYLNLSSREEAIKIGQLLMDQRVFRNLLSSSKVFEDKYVFYTIIPKNERKRHSFNNSESASPSLSHEIAYQPFFGELVVSSLIVRNIVSKSSIHKYFCTLKIDGQTVNTRAKKPSVTSTHSKEKYHQLEWREKFYLYVFHSSSNLTITLKKKHSGLKPASIKGTIILPICVQECGRETVEWYKVPDTQFEIKLDFIYRFLNGTSDIGQTPEFDDLPLSWTSRDPIGNHKYKGVNRCGISDVFLVQPEKDKTIRKIEGAFDILAFNEFEIQCYIQKNPPYPNWINAGTSRTHAGKVHFRVPPEVLQEEGRYPVRMIAEKEQDEKALGNIYVVKPGTRAVVFDIDGTLTTGDTEVIKQLGMDVVNMPYNPVLREDAVSMVRWWWTNGYLIAYLSGRQGTAYNMTRKWLVKNGFPPGIIGHTQTRLPTMPIYSVPGSTSVGVGTFKLAFMKSLTESGLIIEAGYGNTGTDIKAYENFGLPKERTFIVGPLSGKEGTAAVGEHYRNHWETLKKIPTAAVKAPNFYADWQRH